ncbi:MAG TPA: NAD-dependent epimerase/dehydratase family protein [Solirubrobacterales bacterium]|jgi:nucleoside-diphosphate-sugar epimerase|nr:NAD-dependent epimerase/dehydratase family protein [Solirubrobacterales bacterium]
MRVVVTGATGNVGTSVLAALEREPKVTEIVGLARRVPEGLDLPKVSWRQADVTSTALAPIFAAADAVVHLAWAIQPSHDEPAMERVNVLGSQRVFGAAAEAGVATLVYASSVGAYSSGPKDERVGEDWATDGIDTSAYSRHKSQVERLLDDFSTGSRMRVVRLRPGLIFKAAAAAEIRRFFLGPLLPNLLVRPRLIPFVPDVDGLRFQAVHADDVGDAYRRAVVGTVEGAFNIAAEPTIGPPELASLLRARRLPVPPKILRGAAGLTWRTHLQPADPGWIDLALGVPLMDVSRAREELGWQPRISSLEALAELLAGIRRGSGGKTPPLDPRAGGTLRAGEFATGVGERNRSD